MSYRNVVIHPEAAVAPNATIVGDVALDREAVVLFNAVLRGDCGTAIRIGARSNLQEACCVHVSEGFGCTVGEGVTVGHGAILHGCTVEDDSLIGMGVVVLDGAVIGRESLVGAGALVTGGTAIPPRSLVLGQPAKVRRSLTDEEVADIRRNAEEYLAVAEELAAEGLLWRGCDIPVTAPTIALRAES